MKKIILILTIIVSAILTSCTVTQDCAIASTDSYRIITTTGTPVYFNGRVEYYIYGNRFYYPYYDSRFNRPAFIITNRRYPKGYYLNRYHYRNKHYRFRNHNKFSNNGIHNHRR